ncbi:MAG: choloylglycine hydrolase family protein [Pseudomonadota bacterium]
MTTSPRNTIAHNFGTFARTAVAALVAATITVQPAFACTGIILRAEDGTTIPARTMEFGFNIESQLYVVPAGTQIQTLAMNPDETGFTYTAKYGFLGANAMGFPVVTDGMNTEGLYYGAFYFAGASVNAELTESNRERAVSSEELGNWILGQFATVAEVREALPTVEVVGTYIDVIQSDAPVHYSVVDASGDAIVIEYTKDGLAIHENTVHAVTNNPTYDWHPTNLRNYIGLNAENRPEITVGRETLRPFGQGTGMVGLPGDYSSPSRFVRAVAFANTTLPIADGNEGIFRAFHILNAFDIPKGAIREAGPDGVHTDYTIWTSAADTRNGIYYYKTYETQSVESVDVRAVVAKVSQPTSLEMETGFVVRDRTGDF